MLNELDEPNVFCLFIRQGRLPGGDIKHAGVPRHACGVTDLFTTAATTSSILSEFLSCKTAKIVLIPKCYLSFLFDKAPFSSILITLLAVICMACNTCWYRRGGMWG